MGIDFDVNVSVKTTGKEQVDALERQIESLKSQTVNIPMLYPKKYREYRITLIILNMILFLQR